MNPTSIKRETAIICRVDDLLRGSFVKTEGWNPSYVTTSVGDVSRANVMGVIVASDENGLVLDDGSGRITLRSFEATKTARVEIGQFVMVIGRPRTYNGQIYIVPEIIKSLDPKWGTYRQMQLGRMKRTSAPTPKVEVAEDIKPTNHFQQIMNFIKDLDTGTGADTQLVIKRAGVPNADHLVKKLIEEGEIFEIKPGRLKLLE